MSCRRPSPSWSRAPQHAWSLDEIKHGNILNTHSLNSIIQTHKNNDNSCITFGRIADDPALVDIVTAHESCSRLHARIAFDKGGTPWLRDLGSGNGTFVNEKRLPREACGKEVKQPSNTSHARGSRGVVLYPGDAIRFGASTRIYILEGPEEYERDAIKLKRKMMKEAGASSSSAAPSDTASGNDNGETPQKVTDGGCSWGMSDDVIDEEQEQKAQVNDHSDLPPLPSIDDFFYSSKYKISATLQQLHTQYNTKMHKLQLIQKESHRIMQKENMGVELTDGQRGQLSKNQERITSLEKDIANLKDRIEDGMHTAIHGKARINKRPKEQDEGYHDDEVDDFYDRTASSSKRQRQDNGAESEQSLIRKWKSLLDEHAKQEQIVSRALQRCTALQTQIDNCKDDEEAFFVKNDLALANDNLGKARKSAEETEKELDEVEYLLKIVNPKLVWDRMEGSIGTNIEIRKEGESGVRLAMVQASAQTKSDIDATENDSIAMPPPPPAMAASLSMPPPPPKAVAPPFKPMPSEQAPILGPMRPPATASDVAKSGDESSMPITNNLSGAGNKPETMTKRKQQIGPARPPARVQGTLAALKQAAVSQPISAQDGMQQPKKKMAAVTNPFDQRKDEWKAPVDQDGSGRTALHDKFKGRY